MDLLLRPQGGCCQDRCRCLCRYAGGKERDCPGACTAGQSHFFSLVKKLQHIVLLLFTEQRQQARHLAAPAKFFNTVPGPLGKRSGNTKAQAGRVRAYRACLCFCFYSLCKLTELVQGDLPGSQAAKGREIRLGGGAEIQHTGNCRDREIGRAHV